MAFFDFWGKTPRYNYGYASRRHPNNVSCFGWEGNKYAAYAYIDGGYFVCDRKLLVNFGVKKISSPINWYLADGYLPCFISEFEKDGLSHTIKSFADRVEINGRAYVIAYSSMTTKNLTAESKKLPVVSKNLLPFGNFPKEIGGMLSVERTYCIGIDRFGGDYEYPEDKEILSQGNFNKHFRLMRKYWNERLSKLVDIEELPEPRLIDAYKAGYIFTMLCKVGDELHVGKNGYDRVFDHDIIGILSTLVTLGDFEGFEAYAKHILDNVQYPDARWKYSLPFALYLQKTDDTRLIARNFDAIKSNARRIAEDRCEKGVMISTNAIDSDGFWLIDNWSALAGLTAYSYICNRLGETAESEWAKSEYSSLKTATESVLAETMQKNGLDYLPVSVVEPNDKNRCKTPNDANWAAHFLFGRWAWEGYLLGAEQDGIMLDAIDATYAYGFERLQKKGLPPFTFGGFPGECSAYNAGYGSAALRGEAYRDVGINAYKFLIENSMSAPYSCWENQMKYSENVWKDKKCVVSGWGSCPHIWGQSVATKVLLDSLVSEKADGSLILGRGIPSEWIKTGRAIKVCNYPTSKGRITFRISRNANTVTLTVEGLHGDISLELLAFKDNIAACKLPYDEKSGTVTAFSDTDKLSVTLKK